MQSNEHEALRLKGAAARQAGDRAAAVAHFNQALRAKPDFAEAAFELAVTLEECGQAQVAAKTYEYLLKVAPGHAQGTQRLAALARAMQQVGEWHRQGGRFYREGDMENAVDAYRKAANIYPLVPEVLANMGLALARLKRFSEAREAVERALSINPHYIEALNTLAGICHKTGEYEKAAAAYRQALSIKPDYFIGWVNLGKLLQETGDDTGSAAAYEEAYKLNPGHAEVLAELMHRLRSLCRWERLAELEAQLWKAIRGGQCASPFIVSLYAPPQLQLSNARRWVKEQHATGLAYDGKRPISKGKLRIGYLSADLQKHATAFLISEMFEHHDREKFEIFAYSSGRDDGGPERKRIASACAFRDIGAMSDREAAELIQQDGVDILVDLKGYTLGHRMEVMARRPAPIQMHYLGYPGTSGANFIDYFIADAVTAPGEAEALFSEALIRLPHSYQINDRKRPLPAETTRVSHGLPETGLVFCGFNRSYKITPEIFSVWMRLLKVVDKSVLWLLEPYAQTQENLWREAEKHSVARTRIIMASMAPLAQHMSRYAHCDLFLDTSPVCGHTTASDALWCGVPVVTMAGESFAGRVAASLLHAVELPELVTHTIKEYEALALALALDEARRARIKKHLAEGRMESPLFDSAATTKALEAAYRKAAELHRAGKPPQAFAV